MKSKIVSILFLVLTLNAITAFGQAVLLEEKPETNMEKKNWGPNRNNYIQFIIYRGQYLPIGGVMLNTNTIQNQSSGVLLQYKRKLNNVFSGIAEAVFNTDQFGLSCDEPSQINGASNYYKEFLTMNSAGINGLVRINFDKRRGNHLGKFIEFGLFADYLIKSTHKGYYKGKTGVSKYKKVTVTESGLEYIVPFHYGFLIRLGVDKYGFYYRNRYTNWILDPTIRGFLPTHQLGLSYCFTD